ncbi:MAG TPA: hypothetical protein VME01_09755, partial [Solirubrobacteraceae bacterium]|nr:hypothetical protein [Solirubrobacteraceae bacterium]
NIVRAAQAEGIRVDLDITGAPPRWAEAKNVPSKFLKEHYGWNPNASDFGQFVRAVATRYSGHFTPAGATAPLPKVSFYSLWNEPNMGQDLGPQNVDATKKSAGYAVAPLYYRNLLRSGWTALKQDAKGAKILIGELAGQGKYFHTSRKLRFGLPGEVAIAPPVPWIQDLYCVNAQYKPLTGRAGKMVGCPTNAAGRRSFVKKNPALFDATAFSLHPYASLYTPTAKAKTVPSRDIIFPVIGRATRELQHATSAWHHTRKYNVWSTEYGYITSPPQTNKGGKAYPSPAQAAIYLNESEYLSYRNPRIDSYAQYLINDPAKLKGIGLFASGLFTSSGKAKPALDAYRMPVWLPKQKVKKGQNTYIWGGARPAAAGYAATRTAQQVELQQLQGGTWQTLRTLNVNRNTGYFTTHYRFTRSGAVRLAYTYPASELALPIGVAGTTVYSRSVPVNVH